MMRREVTVGDEVIRLEPFSGRKAIRVIRTIEHITKGVPEILNAWGDFQREYEERNVQVLDRASARHYFRPEVLMEQVPVMDKDGLPVTTGDGSVLSQTRPMLDESNEPIMGPDPLGHMTDEDWAASGNKLRLPKSPSQEEKVAAIFPKALDLAEKQTLRLLALLVMSNSDLKKSMRSGGLDEALDEKAEELLDAEAGVLVEIAVTAGEMVDDQFRSKIAELGDRLPNALRLFGMDPKSLPMTKTTTNEDSESRNSSSETSALSSTDSRPSTGGTPAPSSTATSGAS